jgi:hypothetical protein
MRISNLNKEMKGHFGQEKRKKSEKRHNTSKLKNTIGCGAYSQKQKHRKITPENVLAQLTS